MIRYSHWVWDRYEKRLSHPLVVELDRIGNAWFGYWSPKAGGIQRNQPFKQRSEL